MVANRNGFTLVELLVVLAIMAILLIIIAPNFLSVLPQTELKIGAQQVAAALREARSRAILSNKEVMFIIDVDGHYFRISDDKQNHALPQNVRLSLHTAQRERFGQTSGSIRFFPDGSSSGGRIALSGSRTSSAVTVNWLTGAVEIVR